MQPCVSRGTELQVMQPCVSRSTELHFMQPCASGSTELHFMQPCVEPTRRQQLRMAALFNQSAAVHGQHAVGVFYGGQAVCDDDGGAAFHQPVQRVLHRTFAFAVQRRGGFVQDQHGRVFGDGACDGQPLALPARQLVAVVADGRVQALRQAVGKVEQVRGLQCGAHRFAGHGRAQADVGRHRVVEQHHVLADQRKLAPQRVHVPVGQGHAVQRDAACRGVDEAWQQVDQRGLAGS
jgi:hypothetical protein